MWYTSVNNETAKVNNRPMGEFGRSAYHQQNVKSVKIFFLKCLLLIYLLSTDTWVKILEVFNCVKVCEKLQIFNIYKLCRIEI
jgi:hypothetical protein